MDDLSKRALRGVVGLELVLAVLLFVPAGSLRWTNGWAYWTIVGLGILAITLYFLRTDPRLIERRLKGGPAAETERGQKIILASAVVLGCALIVVPGLDFRFGWSRVPSGAALSADALVLVGLLLVFFVFKANSFAAGTITVEADQAVVSAGPYRFVRHPMYAGAVVALLATPIALGSWWSGAIALALCGAIVFRLLDEERYLSQNLPGYDEYRQTVRYRLIPGVW